jgi:endonuclease/exonuclease/phosphatase family metal-dependent hydrolase
MTGASAGPRRLRVVTWNIRAAIGPGEPFPPAWWRHVRADRLAAIAEFIVGLRPDVVTLQEVTVMTVDGAVMDQPEDLARRTGLHARYAAVHSFPLVEPETLRSIGSAMWGNAVLTTTALVDGFAEGLPRAGDDDLVEPDGADHPLAGVRYGDAEPGHREARCVVGGRIGRDGPFVATTHVTYIGRDQRSRQAGRARAATIERAGDGPVILTGDFNARADAPELASLRAGLDDAFAAVGVPAGDDRRRSCGPFAIDHVLVRGVGVESCRVATEAGDLSDHWPVVADLRIA